MLRRRWNWVSTPASVNSVVGFKQTLDVRLHSVERKTTIPRERESHDGIYDEQVCDLNSVWSLARSDGGFQIYRWTPARTDFSGSDDFTDNISETVIEKSIHRPVSLFGRKSRFSGGPRDEIQESKAYRRKYSSGEVMDRSKRRETIKTHRNNK